MDKKLDLNYSVQLNDGSAPKALKKTMLIQKVLIITLASRYNLRMLEAVAQVVTCLYGGVPWASLLILVAIVFVNSGIIP